MIALPHVHQSPSGTSGLGGVRALAGLGCGCSSEQATNGLGSLKEFVLAHPLLVGLMVTGIVGVVIVAVQAGE